MFTGFTDRTFEFYMAIRFNNNRAFFADNRDWYERDVRKPMVELCQALAPVALEIDDSFDTRPVRCVARVNRDTRFSKDKAPYRDYSFLKFKRPSDDNLGAMALYFDISDDGARFGLGIYDKNPPLMEALRGAILRDGEHFAHCTQRAQSLFTFHPNTVKRMTVPETVPDALRDWYTLRGFYMERPIDDFDLIKSPRLPDEIARRWREAAPLFRYIAALTPVEERAQV